MSYLDHIRACNRHDLAKYQPLLIGGTRYGWVGADVRAGLLDLGIGFEPAGAGLRLSPALSDFEACSAAFSAGGEGLAAAGLAPAARGEPYAVTMRWADPPVAVVDRGYVTAFGLPAYGVHVNGWRRRPDGGLALWIGRRARDKSVAPGKLDNMVAGGQPFGLSLMDNLVKEAAEEAGAPEDLARQASPVGAITYLLEDAGGLKPDTLFCYDLETPDDFTPANVDGEMEAFELMRAEDVAELVRTTDAFKFNVNLVVIDFLLRRGVIDPDREPDYVEIVEGLGAGQLFGSSDSSRTIA